MKNLKKITVATIICLFMITLVTAQDTQKTKITGGEEIEISTRPFQVSLQFNGNHRCGGSILNESWIITAAHCVNGISANNLQIAAGVTEQSQIGSIGQLINVQEILIHPNYNPGTGDNDIALLRLTNEVNYNSNVQPIRIINPANQNLNNAGQNTYASGWGWTIPGTSSASNHLIGVGIPIITNQNADSQLDISSPGHYELTNNMIATGFNGSERLGPCHGDSGGPLTANNNDNVIHLIGLVSWGVSGCVGGTNSPTVYTNVINYEDWIYGLICQQTVLIDDVIHSDALIESSNTLESSSLINNNLIVDFRAGQQIVLSAGFSYKSISDGVFHASIGGNCENVTPSNFVSFVNTGNENDFFSEEKIELNLYPIPSSHFITIKFDQSIQDKGSFTVFNIYGSKVLSELQTDTNGEMKIDISNLQSGIYAYIFKSGSSIKRGKIIKE